MDFSVIMQYISYLLVAIGVMAFVVSTVTQVVKSWPGLDKHVGSGDRAVPGVVPGDLCGADGVDGPGDHLVYGLCVYDRGLYGGVGGYGWMGAAQGNLGPDRLPEKAHGQVLRR